MLTGSCLCGGVKYQIDGALGAVTNCHCSLVPENVGLGFFERFDNPCGFVSVCFRYRNCSRNGTRRRAIIGFFAAGAVRQF